MVDTSLAADAAATPSNKKNGHGYEEGAVGPNGRKIDWIFGATDTLLVWEEEGRTCYRIFGASEPSPAEAFAVERYNYLQSRIAALHSSQDAKKLQDDLSSAFFNALCSKKKDGVVEIYRPFEMRILSELEPSYLAWAAVFTLIAVCILALVYWSVDPTSGWHNFSLSLMAASAGALASVLQKAESIGAGGHYNKSTIGIMGAKRVAFGILAGGLVVGAIQANLLLGAFRENSLAVFVFAFAAGFSERLVVDYMARMPKA